LIHVRAQLPTAAIECRVDPGELAPWTAAFWASFPRPTAAVARTYTLQQVSRRTVEIRTPAGIQRAPQAQAEQLWDQTLRAALTHLAGAPLLHAATAVGPAGTLLLTGPSGAGKSTLLRHLLQTHGWRYGGDDLAYASRQGIQGIPRCLEWPPPAPAQLAPQWRYSHTDGPVFAHWLARLQTTPIPWRLARALVFVDPQRTTRVDFRP